MRQRTEDALRAILTNRIPIQSFDYAFSWWAGLSAIPGEGCERVSLKRQGDRFEGTVAIIFNGYTGKKFSCESTVEVSANLIDSPIQSQGLGELSYQQYSKGATTDCGAEAWVDLGFGQDASVRLIRPRIDNAFWPVAQDDATSELIERCGLLSPALTDLVGTLLARYQVREQANRLGDALKAWLPSIS